MTPFLHFSMNFSPRNSFVGNLLSDLTFWVGELSGPGFSVVRKLQFKLPAKRQVCSMEGEAAESGEELPIFCTNHFEVVGAKENKHFSEFGLDQHPTLSMIADSHVKLKELEFEFSQTLINLDMVRSIAASGLPDGGFRATTWKLLLGYLPTDRTLWESVLSESRSKYMKLKEELLINPTEVSIKQERDGNSEGVLKRSMLFLDDHPLSIGKGSVWNQYFRDAEIVTQIDRDLPRTHPDNAFFTGESSFVLENQSARESKLLLTMKEAITKLKYIRLIKQPGSMRSILFIFAKLNPDIGYVQGMNEVLAPLFFIFKTDPEKENDLNAEADSFACFVRLMSDSVGHYCQQFDNSSLGILSTLTGMTNMLKSTDEELWMQLEKLKVKPQYYAFRWITLLLTQEFDLYSILRIWDSLLSNPLGVQEMLLRICCAMLLCIKTDLLNGDFAANMKLLQHFPLIDVEHLLQVAKGILS